MRSKIITAIAWLIKLAIINISLYLSLKYYDAYPTTDIRGILIRMTLVLPYIMGMESLLRIIVIKLTSRKQGGSDE